MINKKSLNKIAQDTYIVNQDLDYFSKQPVYNKMNDENSLLFFWSVVTKSKLFENGRNLQRDKSRSFNDLKNVNKKINLSTALTDATDDVNIEKEEKGKVSEVIAKKTGLSPRTYECAKKIIERIRSKREIKSQ